MSLRSRALAAVHGMLREDKLQQTATHGFRSFFLAAVRKQEPAKMSPEEQEQLVRRLQNWHTLMRSRRQYTALFSEYHKGELSVEAAARKVGLALPKRKDDQ